MTPRARILKTLAHQQPDYCPYTLGFGGDIRQRLVAHPGELDFDADLIHHIVGVSLNYPETKDLLRVFSDPACGGSRRPRFADGCFRNR